MLDMNMNRVMFVRMEEENKTKVSKYIRHNFSFFRCKYID